ncbi:hypothetical protein V8E36_001021 [Tilletia maclaganii]
MSLARTIKHIRAGGLKKFWHDLHQIGDAKSGTFMGEDRNGNKFYENLDEIPGRHRWVDFAQSNANASQVDPAWRAWLQHIKKDVPSKDPVALESIPSWLSPPGENLTGTRGAYKPYSTTAPKIIAWEGKPAPRN